LNGVEGVPARAFPVACDIQSVAGLGWERGISANVSQPLPPPPFAAAYGRAAARRAPLTTRPVGLEHQDVVSALAKSSAAVDRW
jgi:hypothetical protein